MNKQTISKVLNFCDAVSKKNNIQQLPYEIILKICNIMVNIKDICFMCEESVHNVGTMHRRSFHHGDYYTDEMHDITDHFSNEQLLIDCKGNPYICDCCRMDNYFYCNGCEAWVNQSYQYAINQCEDCNFQHGDRSSDDEEY